MGSAECGVALWAAAALGGGGVSAAAGPDPAGLAGSTVQLPGPRTGTRAGGAARL